LPVTIDTKELERKVIWKICVQWQSFCGQWHSERALHARKKYIFAQSTKTAELLSEKLTQNVKEAKAKYLLLYFENKIQKIISFYQHWLSKQKFLRMGFKPMPASNVL